MYCSGREGVSRQNQWALCASKPVSLLSLQATRDKVLQENRQQLEKLPSELIFYENICAHSSEVHGTHSVETGWEGFLIDGRLEWTLHVNAWHCYVLLACIKIAGENSTRSRLWASIKTLIVDAISSTVASVQMSYVFGLNQETRTLNSFGIMSRNLGTTGTILPKIRVAVLNLLSQRILLMHFLSISRNYQQSSCTI